MMRRLPQRVIAQRPVPVVAGDDVSSLRGRVQQAERELLIHTIPKLAGDLLRATPRADQD
jgi:folate-dependent phosphoribosylglycinamide formyltransferase PurN